MKRFIGALVALSLFSACAHHVARDTNETIGISTLQRGGSIDTLTYNGHWQFIVHRRDGRFHGASARSFHPGDSMSVVFTGSRLRLYGITGKNGGDGLLLLPGVATRTIDFYSTKPSVHAMLFDSGPIADAIHSAGIVVVSRTGKHGRGYVNIDEIEVDR